VVEEGAVNADWLIASSVSAGPHQAAGGDEVEVQHIGREVGAIVEAQVE
jgi:hypothetical protein